jgi:ribonuclease D
MDLQSQALSRVTIVEGDVPKSVLGAAADVGMCAIDTETSGLDWRKDVIGLCQVFVPGHELCVVTLGGLIPANLRELICDAEIVKVFHHATFDLRFIRREWLASAKSVQCTKIASKVLDPNSRDHSLKTLLSEHLRVVIDKRLRTSNWLDNGLSIEQVRYAADDVVYLPALMEQLRRKLLDERRWTLAESSFKYLPVRVELEIVGAGDVFLY